MKDIIISKKKGWVVFVLFLFFCYLGIHRFYLGKIRSGCSIILLEILGIIFISLKIIIISSYYNKINYNEAFYFYNLLGMLGHLFFIIAIVSLFMDIVKLFSGDFLDSKGKKVIF